MTSEVLTQDYKDLLYIMRCAVRQEDVPPSWQLQTPLKSLFKLASFHAIEALLYDTVKKLNFTDVDKITLKQWQLAHDKAYRRYLMFTAERQVILAELEKQGIWYLTLKGIVLQEDYPKPYYRQMSDNDIVFDSGRRRDVREFMVNRGYSVYRYNHYHDDIYHKDPFYNFEMHVRLSISEEYEDYFENIDSRLIKTTDYARKMKEEDYYIYLLLHELKHYHWSGVGLRYLIDLYFYLIKHDKNLDWTNINKDLKSLNVADFEDKRRELVDSLFSADIDKFKAILNDDVLAYYCTSGIHGTFELFVDNKLNRVGNSNLVAFYYKKLLNSFNYSITNTPILQKYRVLIPFYMIFKIGSGVVNKNNWKELGLVIKKLKNKDK